MSRPASTPADVTRLIEQAQATLDRATYAALSTALADVSAAIGAAADLPTQEAGQ